MIQVYMEIFGSMLHVHGFLPCPQVSLTESCSFGYSLKDLLTLHKLADSLAIKSDDIKSGRRDLDLYGWLQVVYGQMG